MFSLKTVSPISRDPLSVYTGVKVDAESKLLFGHMSFDSNFQCFLTIGAPYRWLAVTAVYLVLGRRGQCVYVCMERVIYHALDQPPPSTSLQLRV